MRLFQHSQLQNLNTKRIVGTGKKQGRTFVLTSLAILKPSLVTGAFSVDSSGDSARNKAARIWELWHARMEHFHTTRLNFMFDSNLLPDSLRFQDVDSTSRLCSLHWCKG
ncbi:hypothetical protein LINGRAHAP2_LOCUS8019 [Linum grandiflorum]